MKETTAKRREKQREAKPGKQPEKGPEPQDVEMPEEDASAAGKPHKELDTLTLEDIREHVKQIEKAVSGKEPRFVLRALRALPSTSRRLNPNVLHKAVSGFFTSHAEGRDFLLSFLEEPMDTEGEVPFRPRTGKAAAAPLLPEVEAYLQLLLVVYLTNNKRYAEAQKVSDELLQKISSQNRRALDLVAAKCYYYHSRVSEFLSELDIVRSFLHARLRTATLRHDADGQATLLNLLLRNYLQYSLYDQAEKLVSKSVFPELANNNEWARYLYYTGLSVLIEILALAAVLTRSAPLTEFSGEVGFSLEDPDFQKFVANSFDLTSKIQNELQTVLKAHALQLPSDLELGVMEARLQIPSTPLRECLSKIHVESCLARIQSGLRLYRGFLPVVQDHVEPAQRRHVETLSHDAKDLLKQIHRQGGPSSHQPFLGGVSGESERRVGSYILLRNFERFVLSVYRALRSLKRH
ncbi:UNVERIFIED_CONTAM: hypothetical protein FKN15_071316 [Acipenser sinensis]